MSNVQPWKTLSSEHVYHYKWFKARKDACEKPDGSIIPNYYVIEYDDWVTALALTEDNKVILVRQYRHALGEISLELPGGCVDSTDPTLEDAMRREMLEETGYAFETMHYLGRISPNASTNANLMHMFVATGGRKVQEQQLDEHEFIEIVEIPLEELLVLLQEKRIVQAMHVANIFYALQYLGKVKLG